MTPEELAVAGVRTFRYDAYLLLLEAYVASTLPSDADDLTRRHHSFGPLNLKRVQRIGRTYVPSQSVCDAVRALDQKMFWLVLSEPWCGDSSQCLPQIVAIAALNENISLRIALRDENPWLMERYLTDGIWGIPKLVAFSETGSELFRWGPRPREAQELFESGKEEGLERDKNLDRLHLWYGRNRGAALESELIDLFRQCEASASTSDSGTPLHPAI